MSPEKIKFLKLTIHLEIIRKLSKLAWQILRFEKNSFELKQNSKFKKFGCVYIWGQKYL